MKHLLASLLILATGLCWSASANFVSSGTSWLAPLINSTPVVSLNQPLGLNLEQPFYYTTEFPIINIMKYGGASTSPGPNAGWFTQSNSVFDTEEQAYLQLNSDGYATSLTASPTPPGGQIFTKISTFMNFNISSSPVFGAATIYPAGQYRLKYKGQGTIVLAGDPSVVGGDTCSGLTLSNSSSNTYVSCTFHVVTPSSSGIELSITAITANPDYPRDISVMLQSNAAAYDSGAVFTPPFLAMLAPFSSLRFMTWNNINGEFNSVASTTSLTMGATTLTLSSNWLQPSGAYPVVFIDGEQRNATFTLGSTAVTWTTGLTNAISATCAGGSWTWGSKCYFTPFYVTNTTWATRPKPSNAFWDNGGGVPLEAEVSLCNQLNINCYFNVPTMYSDSDIQSMGQLVMSGTGMQSPFAGLGGSQTATFELSNETWNGFTFNQYAVMASLGAITWPGQSAGSQNLSWNRNWYGMRTAQMASDLQTAVGSTIFARVIPVIGGQMSVVSASLEAALTASYWAGGPVCMFGGSSCNYPVKAITIAPYWGDAVTNMTSSDCTHMTGVTTPLDDFFAAFTGQTGTAGNGSFTYTSVPSGGYFALAQTWINQYTAVLPSYPTLKLISYEGGDAFRACFNTGLCGGSATTCTGWPALVTAAERDARMGAGLVTMQNYWKSNVGGGAANVFHYFQDVGTVGIDGSYELLESLMQPISPLSVAPAKYLSIVGSYIQ